jgi:GT2 family glycosyltransferase
MDTILASDYPHFDVVIVDQSDDDRTCRALKEYLRRPGVLYLRSSLRGLAAGRNEGIARIDSKLIAMTDDDCEVERDWLREIVNALSLNEQVGVVFGTVMAAPHDRGLGFIPAHRQCQPFLARNIWDKHRLEGIGASMGLRRSAWDALHGFDENFGSGSRFCSAEELDFTVRALLTGYTAYATPAARVVHHGFRTWTSGRALVWDYLYGIGAMFAKLLKARHWQVSGLLWHLAWRWALAQPVVDLGRTPPPRLLRLHAFLCGFLAGMRVPVGPGHPSPRTSR